MTATPPKPKLYRTEQCTDSTSWDEFTDTHCDCEYFRWAFGAVVEAQFGHKLHYLTSIDANRQIVAALPIIEMKSWLFGHFGVSLPFVNYGGLICNPEHPNAGTELLNFADQWAKEHNLQHLTLRQQQPLSDCSWALQDHKIAMILELPDSEEALMKSFKAKLRAQVRRPIKEGATARRGSIELLDDFYTVFTRNMRDLGTPVYGRNWFKALLSETWLHTQLIVVYLDRQPVAAAFLIKHNDTMEIPWASSLREFNRFSVNMLLYWESLCYSIDQGCSHFDFGRSSKESPTYRFKKQWGSQEKQLYWYQWTPSGKDSVRLDPKNSKFALATRVWQKLPLTVANFLGPYLVKNLP